MKSSHTQADSASKADAQDGQAQRGGGAAHKTLYPEGVLSGVPTHIPDDLTGPQRNPETLAEAEERIAELEAEITAAKTTIRALLDKVEHRARAAEDEESDPGKDNSAELIVAKNKLDQIVRQRTRALTESEAQLRKKNAELQRLNEMKVEFVSIATHELRTPLTSIVGYLDLMAEGRFGQMPGAMERPLSSLRRNAHRLKKLVDEMLDVSRIDSGRITLYRRQCDLGEIVHHATAEFKTLLADKDLDLELVVESPPPIRADADKIRQATSKLLANAIRHTPEGGKIRITVDVAPLERYADGWARLRIKGDGGGIPTHLRHRIFEPFSDVNTARHHTSSGPDSAGLGLYIARGLIDLHGGLVTVDSEEGTYTEFTVLLPNAKS